MTGSRRLAATAALLALLLLAGPIACGKRGALEAPEGREAEFLYPGTYPAPAGVGPRAATVEDEAAEEGAASAEEPGLRPRRSRVSPFPDSDQDEVTVFGPVSSE